MYEWALLCWTLVLIVVQANCQPLMCMEVMELYMYWWLTIISYPSWRLLTIDVYEILLLKTVVDVFLGNLCIPVSQILPPPVHHNRYGQEPRVLAFIDTQLQHKWAQLCIAKVTWLVWIKWVKYIFGLADNI